MTVALAVPPGESYAPDFAVLVEGKQLDARTRGDVVSIQVNMDLEKMTTFDLTFSNWDEEQLRFKYSEEAQDGAKLALGGRIAIRLGYADKLITVAVGTITNLNPRFPESGPPTIAVGGTDDLQKLRNRKLRPDESPHYRQLADWQIAQQVAARHGLAVEVTREGPVWDHVVQKGQSDAQFLAERARRIDFDCYIATDVRTDRQTLHFERPRDGRTAQDYQGEQGVHELAYGPGLFAETQRIGQPRPLVPSLIEFTPTLTLAKQVSAVTVRGWNPATKEPIAFTATERQLPPGRGESGPQAAGRALAGREEVVVDAPVASEEEARRLATALLTERSYAFLTGSGRIAGLPGLRPGHVLDVHGLGRRFSGEYYVTRVVHTLNTSGFFTEFGARRVYDGSGR